MNINKNEASLSHLDCLPSQLDRNTNKENYFVNDQKPQYINDNTEANMKHEDFEKSNIKKKYKKNLVWDGPRWDLAHFDPTMSARERKKLVYYETLFNKLENDVVMRCNEHNNKSVKNSNHKRKMRNRTLDSSPKNELNDLKGMREHKGDADSGNGSKSENYSKTNQEKLLNSHNSNQISILLTPGRNFPRSQNIISPILEEAEKSIRPSKSDQTSVNERESSGIRRSNDWRVKLLNKRCSLQATPYRGTTP
ncbi:uncharacterized protein ELE39_001902 [Cryptosporidium sp. chipmunk genotype I]|uniref:uncharacterized protein n=1 Tax=Cryptosporidium sp. chipmunk genotype I TaxID=1280935 RepID=UPI00351A1508|nr:hypothetical protein ELE39_001902 [Cryptosporidium sp. chipmunk genotype I]